MNSNLLLNGFGMKWEDRYTDVKAIPLPQSTPVIGGLKWGYYTGNTLVLTTDHAAKPQALVANDTAVAPLNGLRNEPGTLMATATSGKGRVVAVTDAGWISNGVLEGKGVAGVVVPGDDNAEIFVRLAHWAAGR